MCNVHSIYEKISPVNNPLNFIDRNFIN